MADIDFANADSRLKFLQEHLGTLMNGIDSNYGQVLMDELMVRLEKTVSEFNEEVKMMLGQLQVKEEEASDSPFGNIAPSAERPKRTTPGLNLDTDGLSEFEKRLESLDN